MENDQDNIKRLNNEIQALKNNIQGLQILNDGMKKSIDLLQEQGVCHSLDRLNRIVSKIFTRKDQDKIFLNVKAIRNSVFTNQGNYTIQHLESGERLIKATIT